jgi:hypothetical protein
VALYTFRLDSFRIDHKRTNHPWGGGTDTDYVAIGLKVGDRTFPTQTKAMGDLDTGNYNVGLAFENVLVADPATSVIFNYQIVNNGHASQTDLDKALTSGAAWLASQGATALGNALTPGAGSIWGMAASAAVQWLGGIVFADCDGPVAIDQIAVRADAVDQATSSGGTYSDTRSYPGTESPPGCGSNSQYSVTWSVTHERITGPGPYSLRQFLQDHQVTLNPGIRSLEPTNASFSLRQLMSA